MAELVPLVDREQEETESSAGDQISSGGTDDSDVDQVLLDIGASGTRVVLLKNGQFLGCRHLSMGGQDFTKALMSAEKKTWKQAEEAKVVAARADGCANSATNRSRS